MKTTIKDIKLSGGYQKHNVVFVEFDSINDLTNYLEKTETSLAFSSAGTLSSQETDWDRFKFTQTENFEQALFYLVGGWNEMSAKLENEFKLQKPPATQQMRRQVNSVQGYQPNVSRFMMGMPDSMIDVKTINHPVKIITVNKMISALSNVTTEEIFRSSIEAVKLIKRLEDLGYRVKLNIIAGATNSKNIQEHFVSSVTIKKPNERLNLAKMSFPLVHPSMLRRIIFRLREVHPEAPAGFVRNYGSSILYGVQKEMLTHFQDDKNTFLIPTLMPENFKASELTSLDDFDKIVGR